MIVNKLDIVKTVINCASVVGVSKVVGDIIKNNTNPDSMQDKVKLLVGSFVIGTMVADQVSVFIDRQIYLCGHMLQEAKRQREETTNDRNE